MVINHMEGLPGLQAKTVFQKELSWKESILWNAAQWFRASTFIVKEVWNERLAKRKQEASVRFPFHLGDSQTVGGNPDTVETVCSLGPGRPSPSSTLPTTEPPLAVKADTLVKCGNKEKEPLYNNQFNHINCHKQLNIGNFIGFNFIQWVNIKYSPPHTQTQILTEIRKIG